MEGSERRMFLRNSGLAIAPLGQTPLGVIVSLCGAAHVDCRKIDCIFPICTPSQTPCSDAPMCYDMMCATESGS